MVMGFAPTFMACTLPPVLIRVRTETSGVLSNYRDGSFTQHLPQRGDFTICLHHLFVELVGLEPNDPLLAKQML